VGAEWDVVEVVGDWSKERAVIALEREELAHGWTQIDTDNWGEPLE